MAKRKHKGRITAVRTGETPTPERRLQHGGVSAEVIDRDNRGKVLMHRFKAIAECPLDAYWQRGHLTEAEYKAGTKFRHAYFRAILRIQVEDKGSGAHGDPEMSMIAPIYSEQILREAYVVLSPLQKAVIVAVCGHDEWAGGTPKIKTLHRGLERLVDLWKLA
jgi:hypothetical protein